MKPSLVFLLGALIMCAGVAAGAFGAHALGSTVEPADLDIYRTGVRYHLIHGLALLAVALVAAHGPHALLRVATITFIAGIVLFSGSLYTLVLTGERWLGAVTPFGGVLLMIGWICLAIAGFKVLKP
jgi:uncharacterized membrane protein YgdD (TMEM256/DUF423 family)